MSWKKHIIPFLKRNGFKRMEENSYANDLCNVVLTEDGYEIADNEGNTIYHYTPEIYWLIGALTYNGWMNENYIK